MHTTTPPFPIPLPVDFGSTVTDWLMVLIGVLGIIVTGSIAWFTLRATRSANASRSVADQAQVRALEAYTVALNSSQDSAAQQTGVLKALVEKLNSEPKKPRPITDVKWTLERDGKNRWLVRNTGSDTATQATVRGLSEQDEMDLQVFHPDPIDIPPHATIAFSIERSLASPPATVIVVNWVDEFDEERSLTLVAV